MTTNWLSIFSTTPKSLYFFSLAYLCIAILSARMLWPRSWRPSEKNSTKPAEPYRLSKVAYVWMAASSMQRHLTTISALILAFILGWFAKGEMEFSHTYTWTGVKIIQRYDARNYQAVLPGTQAFLIKLCPDSTVDWDPGMTLTQLTFEDRGTCKSVNDVRLGFFVNRDLATGKFIDFRTEEN